MPVIPEGARQSTLNINSIHGGEREQEDGYTGLPAPCVPDRCRIIIDRRYLIEEDLAEVKREVTAMLERVKAERPSFQYEIRDLFEVTPSMTEKDAPIVRTTAARHRKGAGHARRITSSPPAPTTRSISTGSGGCRNCIAYGPGILDLAHQPDEWIGIADMMDSAKVMALVLAELLAP